jgi:hypothetical protein
VLSRMNVEGANAKLKEQRKAQGEDTYWIR